MTSRQAATPDYGCGDRRAERRGRRCRRPPRARSQPPRQQARPPAARWPAAIAAQAPGLVAALTQLHRGAAQLEAGIAQLRDGNAQLADGIGQLARRRRPAAQRLSGQLTNGARPARRTGLGAADAPATGQLASGLAGGVRPGPASSTTGLGTMQAGGDQVPRPDPVDARPREADASSRPGSSAPATSCSRRSRAHARQTATRRRSRSTCCAAAPPARSWSSRSTRPATRAPRRSARGSSRSASRSPSHNNAQVAVGGPGGQPRRPDERHQVTDLARRGGASRSALMLVLASRCGRSCCRSSRPLFSLLVAAATFGVLAAAVRRIEPAARRPRLPGPDVDHRHLHGRVRHLGRCSRRCC